MQDLIIRGTGNSRTLKSIASFLSLYPTYDDFATALIEGSLPVDIGGLVAAGVQQQGTALDKANLLSDATAEALDLLGNPTPNDALAKISQQLSGFNSRLDTTNGQLSAASAPFRTYEYFLESSTWTPPEDMDGDTVFVVAVSGGGGGGGGGAGGGKIAKPDNVEATAVGGGGGGGAGGEGGRGHLVTGTAKVTKGVAHQVIVGAGGVGGNGGNAVAGGNGGNGGNGSDGGASSFLTVVAPGGGGGKGGKGGKIGTAGTATKGGNGGAGGDGGDGGDGICGGTGGGAGAGGSGGFMSSSTNGGTGGKGGKGGNGGNGYGSMYSPEQSQLGGPGENGSTATNNYNSGIGGKGGNGGYGKSGIDAKYGPQFLYPIMITDLKSQRIGGRVSWGANGGSGYASNANNRGAWGGSSSNSNSSSEAYFYVRSSDNEVKVNAISNSSMADFSSIARAGIGGDGGRAYAGSASNTPQPGDAGVEGFDGTGGAVIIFYNRKVGMA